MNLMRRFSVCSWTLFFIGPLVQAQMRIPQVGIARFPDGSAHAIQGVSANLIVASRAIATTDAVSFSDFGGLISSSGVIRMLRTDGTVVGEYESGETLPLLNIDSSLQSATAWLPSKHLLLRWNGSAFTVAPIDDSSFGGRVTFVRMASEETAQFFVVLADSSIARILISLPSARVISSDAVPGVYGGVFVQQSWILSQDKRGLIAESATGNRETIELSRTPLPASDLTIERMSDDWLHISSRSTGANWAVHSRSMKLDVYILPPPAPEAAK
jgi:hypothetical protein